MIIIIVDLMEVLLCGVIRCRPWSKIIYSLMKMLKFWISISIIRRCSNASTPWVPQAPSSWYTLYKMKYKGANKSWCFSQHNSITCKMSSKCNNNNNNITNTETLPYKINIHTNTNLQPTATITTKICMELTLLRIIKPLVVLVCRKIVKLMREIAL